MPLSHLIVPAADLQAFEAAGLVADPGALLGHWALTERIDLPETSPSMPHEMAYARALQIPSNEGRMPWAAFETQTSGQACAWIHPCHLDVGMTDMVLQPLHRLALTDAESRELHALLAPLFVQDGITLRYHSAMRWLALGAQFEGLECASLARVQGGSINDWLPDAGEFPQQTQLARLQAEVQMLLYTHAFNDARAQRGLPVVNSFWIDGAGLLDAMPQPAGHIKLDTRLQDAAHSQAAYTAAWQALLADCERQAQQCLAQGDTFTLSLCGARAAVSWTAQQPGFRHHFSSLFGRKPKQNLREQL